MTEFLQTLIDVVRDLDPILRTLLAGLAMVLETSVFVGLIIPGDTIALVASVGTEGPVEIISLMLTLVCGALIGESIGFFIGRWAGPKVRSSRLGQKLGEKNWRLADHYLGERGGGAVFLSRFLPVLHSLVPLSAGMAGMSYRRFLAWTASASVIWSMIVVGLGASAAAGYEELARNVKGAGYIFAGIAAIVIVIIWLLKKLLLRIERRHLKAESEANSAD